MLAGIPVIVSRHRALPELVTHGVNGLLVDTGDVSSLADALAYMTDWPDKRSRMGDAHRTRLPIHDVSHAVVQIHELVRLGLKPDL
jgi:glycosyltransferase involved in cell wall biosynthesis